MDSLCAVISFSNFQYFNKDGSGGSIEITGKTVVLKCSTFSHSTVNVSGGAVAFKNCHCNITKVFVETCNAQINGNGVYINGGELFVSDLSLFHCSFEKEKAGDSGLRLESMLT